MKPLGLASAYLPVSAIVQKLHEKSYDRPTAHKERLRLLPPLVFGIGLNNSTQKAGPSERGRPQVARRPAPPHQDMGEEVSGPLPSPADYYDLVARAVSRLDDNTAETRQALYERARTALIGQLRERYPLLPTTEMTREQRALAAAIHRVEDEACHGSTQDHLTDASIDEAPRSQRRMTPMMRVIVFLFFAATWFGAPFYWGLHSGSVVAGIRGALIWSVAMAVMPVVTGWRYPGRGPLISWLHASVITALACVPVYFLGRGFSWMMASTISSHGHAQPVRTAIAIFVAYLIAGIYYVWHDTRQPIVSRPLYVRDGPPKLALTTLVWLPATLFILWECWRLVDFTKMVICLALFGIASWIGLMLI